jgi:hypothetical protein
VNLADYLNSYSNLNTVDWASIGPALAKLGIGQNGRDGSEGWQFNNSVDKGDIGWSLTPEAAAKLQGWTVGDPRLQGDTVTQQIKDQTGAGVGTAVEDHAKNLFWDQIGPGIVAAGMGYFAAPALGGALGGGLLGGAGGGAITGGAIAGATGNNVGQGLLAGGIMGGINGAMGNVPATGAPASSVSGVPAEAQSAIDAYAQSPMPDMMQGMPDLGGAQSFPVAPQAQPSWLDAVHGENVASLDQFAQQTPQQVQSLIPEWSQASAPSWLDSVKAETEKSLQQASQQTPAQVNSTMPDVSAIPATVPTSGLDPMRKAELDGYQTNGTQPSPAVAATGGGLLGSVGEAGSSVAKWMAENPGLSKLLLGGASALLSGQGGGTSAPKTYGAPVQWKSPLPQISQGLLSGGGQADQGGYPAAMGLLGGQQNAGAWRWLR